MSVGFAFECEKLGDKEIQNKIVMSLVVVRQVSHAQQVTTEIDKALIHTLQLLSV